MNCEIKLSPAAERVYRQMKPGEWHSAMEFKTNRPTMDQLWRKKLVKRKRTMLGKCAHRPEMGTLYQLIGERHEF